MYSPVSRKSGLSQVTFSMRSHVSNGDANHAILYVNNDKVPRSTHTTYTQIGNGLVESTSGRELFLEGAQGDNIELRVTTMGGQYYTINYCVEYISKTWKWNWIAAFWINKTRSTLPGAPPFFIQCQLI